MSVIMTLRTKGDPQKLESFAAEDPERIQAVAEAAKQHGVIAHRFYGSEDGQILVVDEWPDAESFQRFFEQEGPRIGPMMAQVGAGGEPEITFWRKLETGDEIGWND